MRGDHGERSRASRLIDKKPASERLWADRLGIYDLRTNLRFTLKQNPQHRHDLEDFISCYLLPGKPRSEGVEAVEWRADCRHTRRVLHDLWTGREEHARGSVSTVVDGHDAAMYRLTRQTVDR